METTFDITPAEIEALNSARTALQALEDRANTANTCDCARVATTAEHAGHLVFMVLNYARSYADVAISDDDMHNRQPESVSA